MISIYTLIASKRTRQTRERIWSLHIYSERLDCYTQTLLAPILLSRTGASKVWVQQRRARVWTHMSKKYFCPFYLSLFPPYLYRLTANAGCQAFPHLLCTSYLKQAIPHSYIHFMHSSEYRRLQRGIRMTKERIVEGGHRRLGRSERGRAVGFYT